MAYMQKVPARVGGVDLSSFFANFRPPFLGPRPCGRGGFKLKRCDIACDFRRPRPCGRGGFKQQDISFFAVTGLSPPVWAGWI